MLDPQRGEDRPKRVIQTSIALSEGDLVVEKHSEHPLDFAPVYFHGCSKYAPKSGEKAKENRRKGIPLDPQKKRTLAFKSGSSRPPSGSNIPSGARPIAKSVLGETKAEVRLFETFSDAQLHEAELEENVNRKDFTALAASKRLVEDAKRAAEILSSRLEGKKTARAPTYSQSIQEGYSGSD